MCSSDLSARSSRSGMLFCRSVCSKIRIASGENVETSTDSRYGAEGACCTPSPRAVDNCPDGDLPLPFCGGHGGITRSPCEAASGRIEGRVEAVGDAPLMKTRLYRRSASTRCAWTIASHGDHAKTVNRPS